MEKKFDIAVLGGGPGGYVAAIRAAQLGFKTAVIDKDNLGGICLNWGCIPTKSLLKNAELYEEILQHSNDFGISVEGVSFDYKKIIKRSRDISGRITRNIELLMKKNKVERIKGFGKLSSPNTISVSGGSEGNQVEIVTAEKIIIATGGKTRSLPSFPIDGEYVISSREAMSNEMLPGEIVIVGAGAIGVEFAYFFNVFGVKVTLVEMLNSILPLEDKEISDALAKSYLKRGIDIHTGAAVKGVSVSKGKVIVKISKEGKDFTVTADKVLSAAGVTGNIENIGLEETGVETERSFIKVNRGNYETSIKGVYAIGDVTGPPLLAHVASAEAVACVEGIKGIETNPVDYDNIPGCTYCRPQVASVGLTETKAKELGYELKIGRFPFMASGRAFAAGERDGFVKMIFDAKYGELLGAHIIGAGATELIAEAVLARSLEATYESIVKTVHAHPTLSESVMEAAANAYGESIHI
jgi:dihydrolipoamide dehydrogenase